MPKRVAIVGSGCSGLGALFALKSTDHELHLFEANNRLGGHTNTVSFEGQYGQLTPVDSGFIVMNAATYRQLCLLIKSPTAYDHIANLIAFLKHLGVPTCRTEMTFGITRDQGQFEWAGNSLFSIFAQKRNIFNPKMWRLLFDIIRFNEFAVDILAQGGEPENDSTTEIEVLKQSPKTTESVGEYLDRGEYSQTFRDDYLIPMTACIWSTTPDKVSLHFPIITLVRFLWNHHLLNTLSKRPDWLTIPGGTKQYIDALLSDFPKQQIHLTTKVTGARSTEDGQVVIIVNGSEEVFDHVILATHGNQARQIVESSATQEETNILSGFETNKNIAILHSDLSLMPKRRVTWSAWNFVTESPFPPSDTKNISKICLTYCMNILQHLPEERYGPVLVTLNPLYAPDPRLVQGIWEYSHPLYNSRAIQSQAVLPRIQNTRGISYCGAWTKYGFHEDGFSSGLAVAINHLGGKIPFDFVDSTFSRGRAPELTWRNHIVRIILLIIHVWLLATSVALKTFVDIIDRRVATRRKLD